MTPCWSASTERCLVLAEKGGRGGDDVRVIAASGFELVATMNSGGDYGKKELSPALRNRFTEICDIQVHPEPIVNDLRLIKCFVQAWANFTNVVSSKYGSMLSAAATFVCALFTTCGCIS